MSIMDRILKRREDKQVEAEQQAAQAAEQAANPVDERVEKAPEAVVAGAPSDQPAASEAETIGKPIDGQEHLPTAVSELDPVSNVDGETKTVDESNEPDTQNVETIPIGDAEISSLRSHNYDATKANFPRTYIIEKAFWGRMQSTDPMNPGMRAVKAKRVAEVRAVSLKHALTLLGWDDRNITVADMRDESNDQVDVLIDGKPVSKISVPPTQDGIPFIKLGGNQKKEYISSVVHAALGDEKVQAIMTHVTKKRILTGWSFEPGKHINLKTGKAPKEVVFARMAIPSLEVIKEKDATCAREDAAVFAAINIAAGQGGNGTSPFADQAAAFADIAEATVEVPVPVV